MKIAKLYAFQVTSDPNGGTFAGALYEKESQNKMAIICARFEGIVKVFA